MAGANLTECRRECRESCPFDDDLCRANAILVSQTRRFLALICDVDGQAQDWVMDAAIRIEQNAMPGCRPFQLNRPDGRVEFGYAAAQWVIELYRWLVTESQIPERQRNRMVAVLLGFGAETIGSMESVWQLMWSV
ncbi:MAG: hypothetical protein HYY25_06340 [Candidatus Wallbacteria bacterium]|nr:hypothetical protein [Candidatus Wallbacteria bacterium]